MPVKVRDGAGHRRRAASGAEKGKPRQPPACGRKAYGFTYPDSSKYKIADFKAARPLVSAMNVKR
jgi:hypothetical protein